MTTTWTDVETAAAAETAARAKYDLEPTEANALAWEAAQDAQNAAVRDYRAGREATQG